MTEKSIDISPFRHLYPFESRFLSLRGMRLHYLDQGAGEPVVMVHGNPTWSFYFRSLMGTLSQKYRAIAPDHFGCGLSDSPSEDSYDYRLHSRVEDLEALIDALKLQQKLTLILHDWGGMIGMAFALRHSEKIGRIVLTNTAAFPPPDGKSIPWQLKLIRNFPFWAAPAVLRFNLFARAALFMAPAKRLSSEVRAGLIAPYNSPRNRLATLRFVQDIPLTPSDPSHALLRAVDAGLHQFASIPIMICWGMKDFVFDADYLAQWRLRFPKAQVHVFPRAGHYLLEDEPEAVESHVMHFLNQHPLTP